MSPNPQTTCSVLATWGVVEPWLCASHLDGKDYARIFAFSLDDGARVLSLLYLALSFPETDLGSLTAAHLPF